MVQVYHNPFSIAWEMGNQGWDEDGGAERIRSRSPRGNGVFWTVQVCCTHERTEAVAACIRPVKIKPDNLGKGCS